MIVRDLDAASRREFDLVVIGGGIYGVSLLREAARRGLSACLCEAGDFGSGTSWNSLRIVHGGLRYLQTLDLRRFFQSVAARRQFAVMFPDLVRPLACFMPLYGEGLKRISVMRGALLANDVLSANRNVGLRAAVRLPPGRVIDAREARTLLPHVRGSGMQGAACWYDYQMISSERILIELLHDACQHGAYALNYSPVIEIIDEQGAARGVRVRDELTGSLFDIAARAVINCAGPSVPGVARPAAAPQSVQAFKPSLAFNVLLDIDLGFEGALAVSAPRPGAPMLFLVQQQGTLMAGTRHLARPPDTRDAQPTERELSEFLDILNEAMPGLDATPARVRTVLAGLLPARAACSAELQSREIIVDHARTGGLRGLHTVVGVKYTAAADVARRVFDARAGHPSLVADDAPVPISPATDALIEPSRLLGMDDAACGRLLGTVCAEESVSYLDDLLLRRVNWPAIPNGLADLALRAKDLLGLAVGPGQGVHLLAHKQPPPS